MGPCPGRVFAQKQISELRMYPWQHWLIADHIQNLDFMFPEFEQTLNFKVCPTTFVSNSVYADQEAIDKTGSDSRQKFFDKHKDLMKNVTT